MEGFTQRQTIELTQSNPVLVRDQPIVKGDAQALVWIVTVKKNGVPVDLTGATASLYCARALSEDGSGGTTYSAATIESGGTVKAVLPTDASNIPGPVGCMIRVSRDGVNVAVARMAVMAIDQTGDDILDEGNRIPNLDEIMESIDRCDAAAEKAEGAAASVGDALAQVSSAIAAAKGATEAARTATGLATDGASTAKAAASAATAAATKIDDMTITATGLAAGAAPTAKLTEMDGHYNIVLGLPKGDKGATGATPQITVQVKTGKPGTAASVKQTGTAEAPVIELTIPRGDMGSIGTLTINGKTPDGAGAVELSAADVGALGKDAQAKDSAKLAGKVSEYYIQPRNLLDNSDFTNPVNQRGQSTYATSAAYTIDRWLLEGTACRVVSDSYVSIEANGYLVQRIQKNRISLAKTYTLAVKDSAGNIYVGDDAGIIFTDDGTYDFWSIKLKGREIVWAALYEGVYTAETLPPYTPKGYAAELAECQRYYRKLTDSTQNWGHLIKVDGDLPYCLVACDAPMRATPSIEFTKRQYFSGGWKDIEYNTIYYAYGSYKVVFTTPSDMTNGLYLFAAIDSLSADL